MKTCPQCGTENFQTAASCRMCAAPIESPDDLLGIRADIPLSEQLPTNVIISGEEPSHQHAPASSFAGHKICPVCQFVNEEDWFFCQQCGTKFPPLQRHEDAPQHPAQMNSEGAQQRALPPTRESVAYGQQGEPSASSGAGASAPQSADAPPGYSQSPPQAPDYEAAARPTCQACGAAGDVGALFCSACGKPLASGPPITAEVKPSQKPRAFLKLIVDNGETGATYQLDRPVTFIGRAEADITFPHDGYMSGTHARIIERDGHFFIADENSRNGTFIKVTGEVELGPGDTFMIGKQVFKFDYPA